MTGNFVYPLDHIITDEGLKTLLETLADGKGKQTYAHLNITFFQIPDAADGIFSKYLSIDGVYSDMAIDEFGYPANLNELTELAETSLLQAAKRAFKEGKTNFASEMMAYAVMAAEMNAKKRKREEI